MPYRGVSELPQPVRDKYSPKAQRAYMHAFNSAWDGTCRDGGRQGDREACSHSVAHTAAKKTEKSALSKFIDMLKGMVSELETETEETVEKATKTEAGTAFPAAAYAYVPDANKPSTWKLRLWETPEKKVTARQVGMAVAALGAGFRGQKVQIPASDLPGVKAKVRAAWKRVHGGDDEMPKVLKGDTIAIAKAQQVVKADEELQVLYVPVLVPNVEDSQGDIVDPDDIRIAAHRFAKEYAAGEAELGLDHKQALNREQAHIVEYWLEKQDMLYGEEAIPEGTWMIGVHIPDKEIWESAKSGERTGASIEGLGERSPL